MPRNHSEEQFFERVAANTEPAETAPAPSRLKARIYSTLMRRESESGPLMSLTENKTTSEKLCVFEELVQIAPVGEVVKSINFCRVCHARVLAELIENAPIYWRGCSYVRFKNS